MSVFTDNLPGAYTPAEHDLSYFIEYIDKGLFS